jgi:DNA-3-methyladenine glycosylase I
MSAPPRCAWGQHENMQAYHDEEWGQPVHEERRLFEFLILEGAQAGLSWSTVLAKRPRYRDVFANFDAARVARFGAREKATLLADPGIVRNRLKIDSAISNAKAFMAVQEEIGSFDAYLWNWVDGAPIVNRWRATTEVPAQTELSQRLSKDLLARGFRFVGPTIMYAFMQAVGVVNDHLLGCHRHPDYRARR